MLGCSVLQIRVNFSFELRFLAHLRTVIASIVIFMQSIAHNDLHRDILDKVRTNTLNPVTLVENIKQSPHFRYLFYSLRDYKQKVALLDECIKISTTTCDQNLLEYCTVFMERTLTREEFIGPMRTRPAMYKCYENYLRSSGKKEDLRRLYIDLDDLDGEFRLLLEDVFASRDPYLRLETLESALTLCALHEGLQHHTQLLDEYRKTLNPQ
eukprot:TRINITY_DN3913_c0_g1_i3.p1 TRINITY_DN3913_c0_g1~~TRINITY_DN3913_c0_g1_i3.p1  ORF type:complete len:211 (+),score=31.39 TRINITY_DN3913_c0_g1_i3:427-1059(+)